MPPLDPLTHVLFGPYMASRNDSKEAKRKHWVPKKALGAQGSTGCSRKHWVLKEALGAALGKKETLNAFVKNAMVRKAKFHAGQA